MSLQLDDLNLLDAPESGDNGKPLNLSLDSIDEDPSQPRQEFDEESLRELADTITQRGVKQPISVRPHPDQPDRWMLNFGARRLRASRLAGKTHIPAFVDLAADSYDQVIENEQREPLKPLELALYRIVVAGDRGPDAVAAEQDARAPRVLGGDHVNLTQQAKRAQRHVLEVPERRRDHVQRPGCHAALTLPRCRGGR